MTKAIPLLGFIVFYLYTEKSKGLMVPRSPVVVGGQMVSRSPSGVSTYA